MPPRQESGGIEFAALELRACWEKAGHEVTWVSSNIPRLKISPQPNSVRVFAGNFLQTTFGIDIPLITPFCIPSLRKQIAKHDLVITHSLTPGVSVLVMALAVWAKKPVVTTQHVPVIDLSSRWVNAFQKWILVRTAAWAVRKGVRLTFVSEVVRDWFQSEAKLPADRLHMTRVGINNHDFAYVPLHEKNHLRDQWSLSHEQTNLLFVGRFEDKKGLPLIRELAAARPDVHFTLRGHGSMDIDDWKLANVDVIGFVTPQELRSLYGAHDMLILPSFGEGWPAVVPQAMACGLPCMISPEAFEGYSQDAERFQIVERTLSAWKDAIHQFSSASPEDEPTRQKRSTYAHHTWSWERTAKRYLELLP